MLFRMIKRFSFVLCLLLSLSACKVELHTGLNEAESNEMVALLLSNGLDAEKGAATKEGIPLMVESADLAQAIELLRENGLPRDSFSNLGTVFNDQGLISSPLEERIRYIYGLSQSISETLAQIDGVVTARVHVIVPERHPLDDEPQGSSASVFLKTKPGVNLEEKIPDIKLIVQNSVEGLDYENVVVALFESEPAPKIDVSGPAMTSVLGVRVTEDSLSDLMIFGGGLAGLLVVLAGANVALVIALRRARRSEAKDVANV